MEQEKHPTTHESHHEEKPFTKKARSNPWMISTVVLAVFALILIIGSFSGIGMTGNVISEDEAGQIIVDFAEQQTGEEIELVEIGEEYGLYEVTVLFKGQEVPLYLTKDGENLIQGVTPLSVIQEQSSQANEPVEVPKSDKPSVELFIMTHCPYGTQAEKGFIPVIEALGDTIDAKIRFVHYFMHDPEETETPRQVCIREEQSSKFLPYLECFLEDGDAEACISEVGIDETKLQDCIDNGNADDYYALDSSLSEEYGVRGSPTLVINGVIASSERSPSGFLQTVCGGFNTAPEECSQELSTDNPSPGFGTGTSSGSSGSCG
jgi:protein-disulfide isomerase